ncbi:MAG: FKBP-type peptidyl-prolyl cis-trans isomerase [Ferruginibacter sp.]
MKKITIALLLLSFAGLTAQAQTKPAPKPAAKPSAKPVVAAPILKNGIDSFSYAVGMNIAASMKQQGVTNVNGTTMQKAINDVLTNKTTLLTNEQANMTLQQKLQEYAMKKANAEKEQANIYLASNKNKPGVISLPNGLQYEVITAGDANGIKPTPEDTVVVHYLGSLINGQKFDASYDRGEPATFPLNGVIRGWTEILQLMTKGAKWKVTIPSDLGYGDRGAGADIPPGATLVFDIELLDIKLAVKQ